MSQMRTLAAALLVAGCCLPPAVAATLMRHQPDSPAAGMPFEAVLAATSPFELVAVEIGSEEVRVVTRSAAPSDPAADGDTLSHFLTVPIGPVPAGTYRLAWLDRLPNGDELELATTVLGVKAAIVLSVPARIKEHETFRVTVAGISHCPFLDDFVEVDGSTLVLPFFPDACSILPPPPEPFSFESEPIGPLAPGEYRVVVRSGPHHLPIAEQRFVVQPETLHLQGGRFEVDLTWTSSEAEGSAQLARAAGPDSALFYFFSPTNWEFMVKVLDGCAINGQFWVFGAASTNVGYTLIVRDTLRPELPPETYTNALGSNAPAITDTAAFDCAEVQP